MTTVITPRGVDTEVQDFSSPLGRTPCLSLYQPTGRWCSANAQDRGRFQNLVQQMAGSLRKNYPSAACQPLLEPFEALLHDDEFWSHTLDGLVVLADTGSFRALRIPLRVAELTVVADSFHTKPLRSLVQSVDRYQVLGLSRETIRLFEGNRYALDELHLCPTVAKAIAVAMTESPHPVASDRSGTGSSRRHNSIHLKSDESEIDREWFFRAVDRAVIENYTRRSGLPLILAARPEDQHLFRQLSKNSSLVQQSIDFHPDSLSANELRALAWRAVDPRYQARLESLRQEFDQDTCSAIKNEEPLRVDGAATFGRASSLRPYVDRIGIRSDDAASWVSVGDLLHPYENRLDDLCKKVKQNGGTAFVIRMQQAP